MLHAGHASHGHSSSGPPRRSSPPPPGHHSSHGSYTQEPQTSRLSQNGMASPWHDPRALTARVSAATPQPQRVASSSSLLAPGSHSPPPPMLGPTSSPPPQVNRLSRDHAGHVSGHIPRDSFGQTVVTTTFHPASGTLGGSPAVPLAIPVPVDYQEAPSTAATARMMPQAMPVSYGGRQLSTGGNPASPGPTRQRESKLSLAKDCTSASSPSQSAVLRDEKVLDQVTETKNKVHDMEQTVHMALQEFKEFKTMLQQMQQERQIGELEMDRRRHSASPDRRELPPAILSKLELHMEQVVEKVSSMGQSDVVDKAKMKKVMEVMEKNQELEEKSALEEKRATRAEQENAKLREQIEDLLAAKPGADESSLESELAQTKIRNNAMTKQLDSKTHEISDLKRQVAKLTQDKQELQRHLQADAERLREREKHLVQSTREHERMRQEKEQVFLEREARLAEEKKLLQAERSSKASGADKENKDLKKIIVEQKKAVYELEAKVRKAGVMATLATPGEYVRLMKQQEYEGNLSSENCILRSREDDNLTHQELLKAEIKALRKHLPSDRERAVESTYRELVANSTT